MPYIKPIGIDTVTLPSDPNFHVRMWQRARWRMTRGAQGAMVRMETVGQTPTAKADYGNYRAKLVLELIVDWDLTDENDKPLPVTPESIDLLEPEDGEFLATEATTRAQLRGVEQEGPFSPPSTTP